MNISVKIVKTINGDTPTKAIANMNIDGGFVVHGLKVVESEKGTFVAMPSRKVGDRYLDICHPINSEVRQGITEAVLTAYERMQADGFENAPEIHRVV